MGFYEGSYTPTCQCRRWVEGKEKNRDVTDTEDALCELGQII